MLSAASASHPGAEAAFFPLAPDGHGGAKRGIFITDEMKIILRMSPSTFGPDIFQLSECLPNGDQKEWRSQHEAC
jgi:hypothetical protein